jgi:hypothetical protein
LSSRAICSCISYCFGLLCWFFFPIFTSSRRICPTSICSRGISWWFSSSDVLITATVLLFSISSSFFFFWQYLLM